MHTQLLTLDRHGGEGVKETVDKRQTLIGSCLANKSMILIGAEAANEEEEHTHSNEHEQRQHPLSHRKGRQQDGEGCAVRPWVWELHVRIVCMGMRLGNVHSCMHACVHLYKVIHTYISA